MSSRPLFKAFHFVVRVLRSAGGRRHAGTEIADINSWNNASDARAWCSSCSKVLEKFSSGNDQYVQISERVPSVNCLQRGMCASKIHSDYRHCT